MHSSEPMGYCTPCLCRGASSSETASPPLRPIRTLPPWHDAARGHASVAHAAIVASVSSLIGVRPAGIRGRRMTLHKRWSLVAKGHRDHKASSVVHAYDAVGCARSHAEPGVPRRARAGRRSNGHAWWPQKKASSESEASFAVLLYRTPSGLPLILWQPCGRLPQLVPCQQHASRLDP